MSKKNQGKQWSFEDFCVVYCNPIESSRKLAERLGRSEGAIDAVRASIDSVHKGTANDKFPGNKWIKLVKRADNGECYCKRQFSKIKKINRTEDLKWRRHNWLKK